MSFDQPQLPDAYQRLYEEIQGAKRVAENLLSSVLSRYVDLRVHTLREPATAQHFDGIAARRRSNESVARPVIAYTCPVGSNSVESPGGLSYCTSIYYLGVEIFRSQRIIDHLMPKLHDYGGTLSVFGGDQDFSLGSVCHGLGLHHGCNIFCVYRLSHYLQPTTPPDGCCCSRHLLVVR